jgi:dihydrofolate reductase
MRKIILSMQTSLDGYVVGENDDMSWVDTDSSASWNDVFDVLSNVDTALLGRGMYAEYRDYWKKCLTDPKCSANERKYAQWADKIQHFVVSKTLKDPQWDNTKVISGSVVDEVKKLKAQSGGDIYVVGGATMARTMIDAGLVDEYNITVNAYIAKGGKSIYNPLTNARKLEFISSKPIGSAVVLRYREKK